MNGLTGKIALITGGSSGIGAAITRRLAAEGASVAINYYPGTGEDADALVAELEAAGARATAIEGDVSDAASCDANVAVAVETLGSLDILVNNAGITRDGLLVRMSDEDWDAVIRTNLTGVFHMTRAAGKVMMKARAGCVVNIASVVGIAGNAGQINYSAAKAGVIGMTKTTARELASRGVRCNAVAPGFIETAMTAKLSEQVREQVKGGIGLGRLGSPEDVAAAVAFLSSDEAAYITGHILTVDGGMTYY